MDRSVDARGPTLSVLQASAMLVGIVVGVGIFKTPQLVAGNVTTSTEFIALWVAGGLLMIVGALCYAELGSAHPDAGGEYTYLTRAYGRATGFLFAFGRMAVIQTGAIAAVGFAYGDYADRLLPLGERGSAWHAAICVVGFTVLQLFGTTLSGRSQTTLTVLTIGTLLVVAGAAFFVEPVPVSAQAAAGTTGPASAGLALVFILLSYGGWNEAAYLSGEVRDARRNMVHVLLLGTFAVLILYVVYTSALLYAFGLEGLRQTKTILEGPVVDVFGQAGTVVVALTVCAAAISTINATIFTGARSMYALGRDFRVFAPLGRRDARNAAPTTALVAQCAITLALIAFGSQDRDGFQAMVEYTAPTFWAFLFLVGLSVMIFRRRETRGTSAFRVPLYPLPPLIFCAMCAYLVYSSIVYTGAGALIGLAILAAGVPIYWLERRGEQSRAARPEPANEGPSRSPAE